MSNLARWKKGTPISIEHPIKPFLGLHKSINEAIDDFYHLFGTEELDVNRFENRSLFPAMDITETDDSFTVEVEMPGMGEQDIKITINEDILEIHGEKSTSKKHKDKKYLSREISYGSYDRSISLPSSVNSNEAKATFKKGMLWINIPKKDGKKNHSREIQIEKG
ncbi:Hsp20/alpha crystallin family protein [Legionella sp.]|uniref:Hsp20/alpha crystallin family protein n=1 Tax=Legionella sp. TaxID=459 RepID=UPI003C879DBA